MKLTVCLSASVLALLALPGGVRAAPPDGSNNPYANLDPQWRSPSVTQGTDDQSNTPLDAKQEQAAEAERARNWLLIDYEKEVQRRNADAPGQDKTSNVYLELSLNKDLARLAGLSHIDTDTNTLAPAPEFHAAIGPTAQNNMTLRPAPTPGSGAFTPLITPLSSPGVSSAVQPFSTGAFSSPLPSSLTPGSSFLPGMPNPPAPTPPPNTSHVPSPIDTLDMQTPGMVAAKDNTLPGTPNLNLDSLPDQNGDGNLPEQNPNELPQLPDVPQAMNVDQLHLELNAKLKVPKPQTVQTTAQTQQQQTPAPAQQLPPETPMPISQQPQVTPVHGPIGNPYDILNR